MLPTDMSDDPRQGDLFNTSGVEELDLDGADVVIYRHHFDTGDADRFFTALQKEVDWSQEEMLLFGKRQPIPRLTAWYGDPHETYSYSGIAMSPKPWTDLLAEIRDRTGQVAETSFNSVLLNLYRDGQDSVAWHSDDEPELGPEPTIGSVSLGEVRRFHLRRRDGSSGTVSVDLQHGDVLVMRGPMQYSWEHQVPKTQRAVGPRINMTFRTIQKRPR